MFLLDGDGVRCHSHISELNLLRFLLLWGACGETAGEEGFVGCSAWCLGRKRCSMPSNFEGVELSPVPPAVLLLRALQGNPCLLTNILLE